MKLVTPLSVKLKGVLVTLLVSGVFWTLWAISSMLSYRAAFIPTVIVLGIWLLGRTFAEEYEFDQEQKTFLRRRTLLGREWIKELARFEDLTRLALVQLPVPATEDKQAIRRFDRLSLWDKTGQRWDLHSAKSGGGVNHQLRVLANDVSAVTRLKLQNSNAVDERFFPEPQDSSDNPVTKSLGREPALLDFSQNVQWLIMILIIAIPLSLPYFFFSKSELTVWLIYGFLLICATRAGLGLLENHVTDELLLDLERQQLLLRTRIFGMVQQKPLGNLEQVAFVTAAGEIPLFPINAVWNYVTYVVFHSGKKVRVSRWQGQFDGAARHAKQLARQNSWELAASQSEHKLTLSHGKPVFKKVRIGRLDGVILLSWVLFMLVDVPIIIGMLCYYWL